MDFYDVESEFIDSLDYLSPPVKRIHSSDIQVYGRYHNESAQLYRELRNQCTKISDKHLRHKRRPVKRVVGSSTSLILKRTSETEILERCSVVSYTSLQTPYQVISPRKVDRPLIKVTVIPKTDQTQTANILTRKRRRIPKRVQSSLSNQENCVQTTNLYLVVAGRRRDKIYEIKTTGSATFSTETTDSSHQKHEDLSSVKSLIESMDMGHNKKNDKKNTKIVEPQEIGTNPYESNPFLGPRQLTVNRSSNKSRVRIFGQLGLTDDDRYVLRYGATVNDKPVSDFAQLTADYSPLQIPLVGLTPSYDYTAEVKKDASVQTNKGDDDFDIQQPMATSYLLRESQGTQVNFSVNVPAGRSYDPYYTSDKDVQCICNTTTGSKRPNKKCADNSPKECHSPLVIISVYPKQSREDIPRFEKGATHNRRVMSPMRSYTAHAQCTPRMRTDKIEKKTADLRTDSSSREKKSLDTRKDNYSKRYTARSPSPSPYPPRSPSPGRYTGRSPLPVQKNSKSTVHDKFFETKVLRAQVEKKMPDRYKAMRVIKNKILEKDKYNPGTSKVAASNSSKPIPKNQVTSKKSSPSPIRVQERGTNTDHDQKKAKTKKVIVDNCTKQLKEQWNQRDLIPSRLDSSKVTVNIDGENEYYNLLFDQGQLTTDLRIRKTTKDKACSKLTASLENLLVFPEKEPDTQPTSVIMFNKQCDKNPTNERVSGITIRDSLEISHRREDKNYGNLKNTQTTYTTYCSDDFTNDTEFLAPIKHYPGDDCSITDPIERDKQIRELLGVDRSKFFATTKTAKAHSSDNDDCPLHCFYRRECVKSQVAGFNLVELCKSLNAKSKKMYLPSKSYDTEDSSSSSCVTSDCSYCNENKLLDINYPACENPTQSYAEQKYAEPACKDEEFTIPPFSEVKSVQPAWIEQKHPLLKQKHTYKSRTHQKYAPPACIEEKSSYPMCTEERYTHLASTEQKYTYPPCTEPNFTQPACKDEMYSHAVCAEHNCTHPSYTEQKLTHPAGTEQKCTHPTCAEYKYAHPVRTTTRYTPTRRGHRYDNHADSGQTYNLPSSPIRKTFSVEQYDSLHSIEKPCLDISHTKKMSVIPICNKNINTYSDYQLASLTNSQSDINPSSSFEWLPPQLDKENNTEPFVYKNETEYNRCGDIPITIQGNEKQSSIYQQLILNRNIQVFLQVEQFSKQRPIVLSRKQYDKVKKTIQNTISKKSSREQRKKLDDQPSIVSIGAVRKKKNIITCDCIDRKIQTDVIPCNKNTCRRGNKKHGKLSKLRYGLRSKRKLSGDEQLTMRRICGEEPFCVNMRRKKYKDQEIPKYCDNYVTKPSKLRFNEYGEDYATNPTSKLRFSENGECYIPESPGRYINNERDKRPGCFELYGVKDKDYYKIIKAPDRYIEDDQSEDKERRKHRFRQRHREDNGPYSREFIETNGELDHIKRPPDERPKTKDDYSSTAADMERIYVNNGNDDEKLNEHPSQIYSLPPKEYHRPGREPEEVRRSSFEPSKRRLSGERQANGEHIEGSLEHLRINEEHPRASRDRTDSIIQNVEHPRVSAEYRRESRGRVRIIGERHNVSRERRKHSGELKRKSRERQIERLSGDRRRESRERERVSSRERSREIKKCEDSPSSTAEFENLIVERRRVSRERPREIEGHREGRGHSKEKASHHRVGGEPRRHSEELQKRNRYHQRVSGEHRRASRKNVRVSGERRKVSREYRARDKVSGEHKRKIRERQMEDGEQQNVSGERRRERRECEGVIVERKRVGRDRSRETEEYRKEEFREKAERQRVNEEPQRHSEDLQKKSREQQRAGRRSERVSAERQRVSGERRIRSREREEIIVNQQRESERFRRASSEREKVNEEIIETSDEKRNELSNYILKADDTGDEITSIESEIVKDEDVEETSNEHDLREDINRVRTNTDLEVMRIETERPNPSLKTAPSSLEIHYTSVAYLKHLDMSSSEVAVLSDSSIARVHSFQTIFRGHRKSPTPNLGTSVYSLYTDNGFINSEKSSKYIMPPRNGKANKRPFLMRLMSCLVMRSTRVNLPTTPVQDLSSVNSSVDSYHISTSLGAVEVSSSIYDTTASFYSNHTIMPINSKMKRGFFNSVRGFLTNRKS